MRLRQLGAISSVDGSLGVQTPVPQLTVIEEVEDGAYERITALARQR